MSKRKICLLGASLDTSNMGVSALAESSIKCILNKWPDSEVILLGSGRTAGEHNLELKGKEFSVRDVPIRFCKNIFLANHFLILAFYAFLLRLLPFRQLRNFLMEGNPYLKLILETDFFADITGGDSFSDIYGMRRFVFGFSKKLLPIMFGKELIMLPQTYGPFNRPLTKLMARYILKHAKVIYSRDRVSTRYVSRLLNGVAAEDKVQFVPEVAFILDAQRPTNMDIGSLVDVRTDKSTVVGLNVSGLLYYGGYTRNNMFGLKEDYGRIICRLIDFLLTKEDVLLLLVPHVFAPMGSVESDTAACLDIYRKFSPKHPARIFMVHGSYDHRQIKYIIGLCDFFLGSRMHSCIAALSQMIPTTGLAYSKKFFGVFDSIGIGDLVIDLRTETEGSILASVEAAFSEREAIALLLSQRIPKVQKAILKVFSPGLERAQ